MAFRHEMRQLSSHTRRPPLTTANKDPEADFAIAGSDQPQADIMEGRGGAVFGTCGYGNLEFTRQKRKFWM